jgi:hypothetical protein
VLTVAQVLALDKEMPDQYPALVFVATFGCLRCGEVSALERQDIGTEAGELRRAHPRTWSPAARARAGSAVTVRPAKCGRTLSCADRSAMQS